MTDPAISGYDSFDAELLAKIDGEKLSVGYHNPFLLSDPGLIWLVLKGSVDIYAVPLTDGAVTGTGQHLMRVSEGELIFGMPAIPDDAAGDGRARIGLRAVATMGTELFRARRGDIEQDDFDLIVVDWIDRWIAALAEIVAPVGGPRPTGYLEAEPDIGFPAGAVLTPQRGDTIWVTLEAGSATAIGRWPLKTEGTQDGTAGSAGMPLPLAGNMWLTCETDCRITGAYTPTALFRGTLWSSLDSFHLAAMQVIARQREEAGARETQRLARKAGANRATFNASLRRIGGILAGPRDDGAFADTAATGDPLFDAASLVAQAAGIRLAPPPDQPGTLLRPLADIARRAHIRVRRVVLFDDWYRRDNGPLLAYMAADNRPVALLPDGVARYVLVDPADGTRRPVTPALAGSLSGEAHVFYRPFPARAMRVREVFAFGLRGLRRDMATIALMGILAGLIALATPIATGHIFSSVIPRADIGSHLIIIAGLVLAALGTAVFTVTRSFAVLRVQTRMDSSIQTAVWDRLLALPVPFFRDYSSGDLADRANGINAIREVLSGTIMQSVMTVMFSLFSLLLLFWYSWKLAFIALGIVAVLLG
ncbi:MAG: ABC transporter transmembrane domain-containing protein, partial [Oceanibaculum sp.]